MSETIFFLAAAGSAAPAEPPLFLQPQFVFVIFMVAFMYFMIIRPQQKKQKDHAQMLSKLDKNDEVLTSGGIHGTVVAVGEKSVTVRIADNVKVEVEKSYIQQVTKSRQS
jgi:preprotein translocase subunit YajC